MARRGDYDWTEQADSILRKSWADGDHITVIGDKLGTSKGSVIGRVGRLGLERRDDPTKVRASVATTKKSSRPIRTPPKNTLQPLASMLATPIPPPSEQTAPAPGKREANPAPREAPPEPMAVKAPRPVVVPQSPELKCECMWPLNDRRPWEFCNQPCARLYCDKHTAKAKGQGYLAEPKVPGNAAAPRWPFNG